ncbi:hypothetical protein GCM10022421_08910 [Oceanisphaera sediminis]|uniref:DUF2190 family protein n=1 Tax=Oceanisphaera sediminis TaxID=981381 RepID=A0ABP7DGL9_9GAMM
MAKNYVQDGGTIVLIAPAGGVVSGGVVVINDLVVVSLADAAAGDPFSACTDGVWSVPCTAGLKTGVAVGWLTDKLVAAATASAVAAGKLVTDEAGGYADLRLSN